MSSVQFTRVNHLGASVFDLEATIAWWHLNFGFDLEVRFQMPPAHAKCAFIRRGDTRLELFEVERPQPGPLSPRSFTEMLGSGGLFHVAVEVEDVDAAIETLEANGVEALLPAAEGNFNRFAYVSDPSGNLIELIPFRNPDVERVLPQPRDDL